MITTFYVKVKIEVEHDINVDPDIDNIVDNMDYAFEYDDDNAQIVDSEIMEVEE